MMKFGILLARSSGRDKVAAFFRYGSVVWGNQKIFKVPQGKDGIYLSIYT